MLLHMQVTGIHHITSISSDAGKTLQFYSEILGLRLVKKSVNQDDVSTYHLFFGNTVGSPGIDLTFFPFQPVRNGVQGIGSVTTIQFAIPQGSISFWKKRFETLKVEHSEEYTKFGFPRLPFQDFDGQQFELVEVPATELGLHDLVWETEQINGKVAIHHFFGAELSIPAIETIAPVLSLFGYTKVETENHQNQLYMCEHGVANYLELQLDRSQPMAYSGAGSVHHIAFGVEDEAELVTFQRALQEIGLRPTQVVERYYFQSVYFLTEAGILFELATHQPGFTVDESADTLGNDLKLPPFLEAQREAIIRGLPKL